MFDKPVFDGLQMGFERMKKETFVVSRVPYDNY
jgi:hypothetical protein